ncbi:Sec-independent protein translocase TatA [Alkalicaulis satelles]|uniref:Sec-independent protein translocase TatA n=1 Tax=Alkalicaulis satelles TaxID=2609175 RepID=A0A5M6ZMR4_9PROT|nr:Sec-independent protein translocase TatA [Alkalicaulis satelles]KAA5804977.1 Sec-independent protein translocase TatA [Alkalicaulis satelles]
MSPHWTGILIVALLLLVLFGGRGKISALMGDMAKGITAFRKGLKDDGKDEDGSGKDSGASGAIGSDGAAPSEPRREDERAGS